MKISSHQLLNNLKLQTSELILNAKEFKLLSENQLNFKSNPQSWSILECVAHINFYSDFYLAEFKRITDISNQNHKVNPQFKPGWLGNYSANNMLPKKGSISKMKTFKSMNPIYSEVNIKALDDFINQQQKFLSLLKRCENIDLNKTRCKLTIPIITFNLGDTLMFYTNHNQRHIIQAMNLIEKSLF